jgi:hypothetical protein
MEEGGAKCLPLALLLADFRVEVAAVLKDEAL